MYFLVKFVIPEYTSSLLEGELFFKRNDYFIELEKEKNDKVIGDRREGSWSRPLDTSHKKYFVKFKDDEKMYPINVTRGAVHKQYKNLKDVIIEQFRREFENRNGFIFNHDLDLFYRKVSKSPYGFFIVLYYPFSTSAL